MSADESKSPPLEQVLSEFFDRSDSESPDLRALLADRPEVARQLRRVLDEYERSTALDQATFVSNMGRDSVEHITSASPPHDVDTPTVLHSSLDSSTDSPVRSREKRFGDYELLEEIARGGMGVVYRARQISLDRQVAVKMILSGQLAADGDIKRFYAEAESAARLDHPGIVPIFEVGEHDGQHFYAMAFVQGSSLADRVGQGPLSCAEAAELIRKVAEAAHHAHQHGVIHRDLKPANVLLDTQGQVRVTDFGLAKRADQDSLMTATGQVLGTPSYMPPEQANGQLDKIGPASDVYALGAVLYTMLTGRPPFLASTSVDTLMQVLERDPIPPRRLNSEVDRDLETICMKCLQKEAHQRYASAEEVVAEIERYQQGEPLLAHPVSSRELLWRWYTRLRDNKVVRARSTSGIGRIPWVDIAVGPDTENGQSRGVARGVVAIGDTAWGVVAYGDSARGIVAFGGSSFGVLAIGVKACGLVSVGATGIGLISLSAVSLGLVACGGLSTGWVAIGAIAVGWNAFGAVARGQHVIAIGHNDPVAEQFFDSFLPNVVYTLGNCFAVIVVLSFLAWIFTRKKGQTAGKTTRATEEMTRD